MSRPDAPVLEVENLEVVYQRRDRPLVRAVAGVDLSVAPGQLVGLVGESGCGKSTLARAIVGLERPVAGRVRFEGRELSPLGRGARTPADVRLQMVFQNPYSSLNPRRTVARQLADAIASTRRIKPSPELVGELLERVGLPVTAGTRYAHQLSGGQRQRVAIARALAAEPSAIVLDEPLSSLDASAQAQIANLLVTLSRELSLALVLISHDLAIVNHVADTVAVMYLGTLVESAPSQGLWQRPAHPYTEALIGAIPEADGSRTLPVALAGEVPDPSAPPSGCRFHPRCPYVMERCLDQVPPMQALGDRRLVSCWLHEGADAPASPADRAAAHAAEGPAPGSGPGLAPGPGPRSREG